MGTATSLRFISYDSLLEKARQLIRTGEEERGKRDTGVELLEWLYQKHGHALRVAQELVLGYMECGRGGEAEKILQEVASKHRNPNEEILCRWGRRYKDRGDEYADIGGEEEQKQPVRMRMAVDFYRRALQKYGEAYDIRHGHYPGINKATLHLIVGTLVSAPASEGVPLEENTDYQESQSLAQELLERRDSWPRDFPDDDVWHLATAGEAHLLRRHWDTSAELYREAQAQDRCQPQHHKSMKRQAERILHCFRKMGVTEFGRFNDLDSVFPK